MSISKDEELKQHLKGEPNSRFVNNYFDISLKAWQTNRDIKPVFNEYNTVKYMFQYFSKIEDQCSQAMKQAVKEAFGNNMHHHGTMKAIAKANLSNRKFSVQEEVYNFLPKLKLKIIFPAIYFVNTNTLDEKVQVLLSGQNLDDCPKIFKKSNIDRHMKRPSATFSQW